MKIKKIHMNGYKRFLDLTIDLGNQPARIVALVGPNGCGKSSVFDAMLYIMNAYGHIGKPGGKDYTYHSLLNNPGYNYQSVSIEFDSGQFDSVFSRKQKNGSHYTLFSFRSSFRYNGSLNVTESKAVSDIRENNYGASSASDIDQRIEQNYRRLQIKYNKYLNDTDCRPSEAKAHIIGELNDAISNCLSLKIDNLGDIEAGKGTFFSSSPILRALFNMMFCHPVRKRLSIYYWICISARTNTPIQFILLTNLNCTSILQFKGNY